MCPVPGAHRFIAVETPGARGIRGSRDSGTLVAAFYPEERWRRVRVALGPPWVPYTGLGGEHRSSNLDFKCMEGARGCQISTTGGWHAEPCWADTVCPKQPAGAEGPSVGRVMQGSRRAEKPLRSPGPACLELLLSEQ